jgi:hypothetical protein
MMTERLAVEIGVYILGAAALGNIAWVILHHCRMVRRNAESMRRNRMLADAARDALQTWPEEG